MLKKTVPINADAVVTPSSGNVFTDLGLGPGEAAVMGLRAPRHPHCGTCPT